MRQTLRPIRWHLRYPSEESVPTGAMFAASSEAIWSGGCFYSCKKASGWLCAHTAQLTPEYIHQLMGAKVGIGSTGYQEYSQHPDLALEK